MTGLPLRYRNVVGAVAIFMLLLYIGYPLILNKLSVSLLRDDNPLKADAIVVLSGNRKGECVQSAIEGYKAGVSDRIFFSGGKRLYREIKYAYAYLRQFEAGGVPVEALVWSDEGPSYGNTNEEIIFRLLKKDSIESVVLLAQPVYTAYEGKVFEELAEREKVNINIMVKPCIATETTLEGWWQHRQSAKLVYYGLTKWLFRWTR